MNVGFREAALLFASALVVGCANEILHDLDEGAANQSVGALVQAGIGAETVAAESADGARYSVRVPRRDAARALGILGQHGLPREPRQGFAQIYARPALIPSAAEERARFLLATVGELERTLESVDGVLSARVHLVPAEADPNALDGRNRAPARAAVLLNAKAGSMALNQSQIQQLGSGSVPGLEAAAVAVIVTAAPAVPTENLGSSWTTLGPLVLSPSSRPLVIAAAVVAFVLIGSLAALLLIVVRRRPDPIPE